MIKGKMKIKSKTGSNLSATFSPVAFVDTHPLHL